MNVTHPDFIQPPDHLYDPANDEIDDDLPDMHAVVIRNESGALVLVGRPGLNPWHAKNNEEANYDEDTDKAA